MDEDEIRSLCEQLNFPNLSDQVVAYHQVIRGEKSTRRQYQRDQKKYVLMKVDDFLAFKMEESAAKTILNMRNRFQV